MKNEVAMSNKENIGDTIAKRTLELIFKEHCDDPAQTTVGFLLDLYERMSRICCHCGPVRDDSKVCVQCGTNSFVMKLETRLRVIYRKLVPGGPELVKVLPAGSVNDATRKYLDVSGLKEYRGESAYLTSSEINDGLACFDWWCSTCSEYPRKDKSDRCKSECRYKPFRDALYDLQCTILDKVLDVDNEKPELKMTDTMLATDEDILHALDRADAVAEFHKEKFSVSVAESKCILNHIEDHCDECPITKKRVAKKCRATCLVPRAIDVLTNAVHKATGKDGTVSPVVLGADEAGEIVIAGTDSCQRCEGWDPSGPTPKCEQCPVNAALEKLSDKFESFCGRIADKKASRKK